MQVITLNQQDSVINNYLADIRNVSVQTDTMRFRRNIERIGSLMAYEVSKRLRYERTDITTPLGTAPVNLPADKIVVGSILRAGLPMHRGVLEVFDRAENCFISAYRKYTGPDSFDIHLEYVATPNLNNKILLLCDPMLATGNSLEQTFQALKQYGEPKHTHIMSVIGSEQGVSYLCDAMQRENATLWVAAIDPVLNSHKYIVPGLGDAGDLAFGEKL